ncbi:MAG: NFACT RNA binding domain-containing protein [Candidatus Aenigmarchaeota archaeon]|nr:NFACT RNA binding domain-containing protein [Candidatus Aenigmarchaeota archaeon]MDW8149740.1 NFACT RNA binding domain-containing protein [Candidatus Aenigmarchaeota archaeon]
MRSVEIQSLLKEIKELLTNKKILDFLGYKKFFSIKLENGYLNIFLPYFFFFDDKPITGKRSKFSMVISRLISNKLIENIEQIDFDRIVCFNIGVFKLIVKLFGNGNIILLDENNKGIAHLRKYKVLYEERKTNIEKEIEEIKKFEKRVVDFLSENLFLGNFYAKEILKNCKVDENLKCSSLSSYEINSIKNEINKLFNSKKFYLVIKDSKASFSINYEDENGICYENESLNETIKKVFEIVTLPRKKKKRIEVEKKEDIEKQIKDLEEITRIIEENKEIIEDVIKNVNVYKNEGGIEMEEGKDYFFLKFGDNRIKLFFNKTVEENINFYKQTLENLKAKISVKEVKEDAWYKKFRYFVSSDNFLVVIGTNSYKNEILVKKFASRDDIVMKANIKGSPIAIIKTNGKEVPKTTLEEAALIVACYSKAWLLKFDYCDVFYVKPEQLIKEGWMSTGSFGIVGEKKFIRNVKLELCLGIDIESGKVLVSHNRLVKPNFKYIFYIYPGNKKIEEIEEYIKSIIGKNINIDRKMLASSIPFGVAEIYRTIE